jgi:protein-L-isoaspartate O-methyltransferase
MIKDKCRPGTALLDIGCGSGIFTALMSAAADHQATVIGLDHIPALVDMSRSNVAKQFSIEIGACLGYSGVFDSRRPMHA